MRSERIDAHGPAILAIAEEMPDTSLVKTVGWSERKHGERFMPCKPPVDDLCASSGVF
ncbi:MAG: hypothetical protein AAGD13_20120 [Pseudomonadota bacterium]